MKKFLLSALLLCSCVIYRAEAQREPQFTHYMYNKLIYNPGYAGSQENICATLLYHNQWSNFHSDLDKSTNPITQTFTLHSPLTINNIDLGAGVHFLNDNLGFEHTFSFGADISYRKKLSFANLGAGLSLGYVQTDLKGDWKAQSPDDSRLPGTVSDKSPDIGFGLYMKDINSNWYAGVSALHLTQPKLTWAGGGNSVIPRAYYLIAGYNYLVPGTKFELQPGTLVRSDFAKTQYDLHIIGMYNQFVWGGLNYHAQDALSLMLGLNLKLGLKISFSYDITTSDARPFGGKTEVLLNYCFHLNLGTKDLNYHKSSRYL